MRWRDWIRAEPLTHPVIGAVQSDDLEVGVARSDRGCSRGLLYFDHNATHPLSPRAREAWLDATERFIGNPSSPHRLGQRADVAINEARERLGFILGCAAERIVFTSGATEGNNAVLAQFDEVWVSSVEHPCVMEPTRGRHRLIPVDAAGIVDLDWLRSELRKACPELVAIMAANNETGVLQPWQEAAEICRKADVPLLCDAAQWVGKLPAAGIGSVDYVTGCGHKFGGPAGVGFLVAQADFRPLLRGGPQESGRRAGTENLAGVVAMVAALEERMATIECGGIEPRMRWRQAFEEALAGAAPGIEVIGAGAERLWNTVAVLMPEAPDCRRRWVVVMDKLGFAVSTGSACSSGKEKPSSVLTAMGISPDAAGRALRFSSGWETDEKDWTALLAGIRAAVAEISAVTLRSKEV